MVKKQENKNKLKRKVKISVTTVKAGKNARKKISNLSPISVSSTSLNYTLPDGNHLDSFDQFRMEGTR